MNRVNLTRLILERWEFQVGGAGGVRFESFAAASVALFNNIKTRKDIYIELRMSFAISSTKFIMILLEFIQIDSPLTGPLSSQSPSQRVRCDFYNPQIVKVKKIQH